MEKDKILLVDDEQDLLDMVSYNLEREGFAVVTARNGVEALSLAQQEQPDLIILDVMMPELDGIQVCRRLRKDAHLRLTPILMLTAKTEERDEVVGLDAGADDYLYKPISRGILLSRVRALLRRVQREDSSPALLHIHDLEIDRDRYLVCRNGQNGPEEFRLPRKEFELLHFMAAHPGKVFSRQDLLDQVWGTDVYVVDRTIDVHVRKIREKLGSDYIETVKGVGYKFRP